MVSFGAKRIGLTERQYRDLRAKIFFLQAGVCQRCEKKLNMRQNGWDLHHVDNNPQNNHTWNLQSLCKECHRPNHGGGFYL